jgi:glucose/arabinose dehydrogenase
VHFIFKYSIMRSMKKLLSLLLFLILFLGVNHFAFASILPAGFVETKIVSGLTQPTSLTIAPDGRLFVNEKAGKVRVIKNNALFAQSFLSLPTDTTGERGLLGLTFDPNFTTNKYLYVYYTATSPALHNRVSRFTVRADNPELVDPASEFIVIDLPTLGSAIHNGGALHFGPDGKLYIAVGDNAVPANAQSKNTLFGKILRVNADGSIPQDNPFVGQADAKGEIWAYGLRNPYTFAFQESTGALYVNDVGGDLYEEVNKVVRGGNYGWPTCEGMCTVQNMINPIYAYDHSVGRAITGGDFYHGTQFPEQYRNSYFFADYLSPWIKQLDANTHAVTDFATGVSGAVDLKVGPDGALYYLSYLNGTVSKISYTNTKVPTPTSMAPTLSPIVSPTMKPTISPSASPSATAISLTFFLHGIGNGGDNANPTGKGNMSPLRFEREVMVEVYDKNNQVIQSAQGNVPYNSGDGNFKGTIDIGDLAPGDYIVKVQTPQYLKRTVPGFLTIATNNAHPMLPFSLVTGDTNNDNSLSVIDYNLIIDCYSDLTPAMNCNDTTKKSMTDITDDGKVNQYDYNLFLRELTTHIGE